MYSHLAIKPQEERVLQINTMESETLCKFTLDILVRLFKKMLYRHLVIKPQDERVLQIDATESETLLMNLILMFLILNSIVNNW